MDLSWKMAAAFLLALVVSSCSESNSSKDAGIPDGEQTDEYVDNRPDAICKPGTFGFSGPAFIDKTQEAGLDEQGIDATAFVMSVADLDGDGFEDIIAISHSGVARGMQRIYMNRPDPENPQRRIFEEATETSVDANRRSGSEGRAVAFHTAGDVDNDGDLDLFAGMYVGEYRYREGYEEIVLDRQEILLNDGSGNFSLIPQGSSVATVDPPSNTSAVFFDYDRDGILDLYVANWYKQYPYLESQQDELYKGNGDGTFTLVTEQAGLSQKEGYGDHDNRKPTYGASHCDIDLDGQQDILQASYGRQWNDLWLNNGDGTFSNIGQSSHYDADDLVDYSDNEFYRCHCVTYPDDCPSDIPPPNPWTDCTARGWNDLDEAPFRLNGNTFGAYCEDVDNDLDMDVLLVEIAHGWAGSSSDRTQLLLNDGKAGRDLSFTRLAPDQSGINREHEGVTWNEGDVFGGFIDFDNDGDQDVLIGAGAYPGDKLLIFEQYEKDKFRDAKAKTGINLDNPHSPIPVDYDRDGDLDIITGVGTGKYTPWDKNHVFLFENQMGELNNSIVIRLHGAGPPDGANSFGVGAIVKVTSGDLSAVRQVKSTEGRYGSQGKLSLLFGLGHRCDDVSIEITWPDKQGTVETFDGVRANYEVLISQGQKEVDYIRPMPL